MPGGISFGNVINEQFKSVWKGDNRKSLIADIPNNCQSDICPPFANSINTFLHEIVECKKEYGVEAVLEAVQILKDTMGKE
jgi:hypothetical protein